MKHKKHFYLIATVLIACAALCAACGNTPVATDVYYTVTFNSDGGTPVQSLQVKENEIAEAPAAPAKTDYNFAGWYNGETPYLFNQPVTGDVTLTAKWERASYTVTFKWSSGEEAVKVTAGGTASQPQIPKQSNGFFTGWFAGETEFDFTAPVTSDVTVTAKFITLAEATEQLNAALNASYDSYTAVRVSTEYDPEEEVIGDASYSETFKRNGDEVYYTHSSVGDRYVKVLPEFTAIYYTDNNGEWQTNANTTAPAYVLPLNFSALTADDFNLIDGEYQIKDDSMLSAGANLFGYNAGYYPASIKIADGVITGISGYGDYLVFDMSFTNVGTTAVTAPNGLPAVQVDVITANKQIYSNEEITAADLAELFAIKADGKTVTVTQNMIDCGELDINAPTVGDHTITVNYTSWDGVAHSATAILTVNAAAPSEMTFAEIFARDYSNATITDTSNTVYTRNGDLFYYKLGVNARYILLDDTATSGYKVAQHNTNVDTYSSPAYVQFPRLDLLFALDTSLFVYNQETDTYTITNNSEILTILKYNENLASAQVVTENGTQTYDYSLSIKTQDNYVYSISYSYYTKFGSKVSQKTATFTLSNIGTTQTIELNSEVRAILYPEQA